MQFVTGGTVRWNSTDGSHHLDRCEMLTSFVLLLKKIGTVSSHPSVSRSLEFLEVLPPPLIRNRGIIGGKTSRGVSNFPNRGIIRGLNF